MAVQWLWKDKAGSVTFKGLDGTEYEATIYEGNCPFIALYEYKQDGRDMYDMLMFFVDTEHAKSCLGLKKGSDNIYAGQLTKLRINRYHRHFKKIVKWFSEAFDNFTIEIFTETEDGEGTPRETVKSW